MIRTSQLLIWLAVLLLLIGAIFGAGYFYVTQPTGTLEGISLFPDISVIAEAKFEEDKTPAIELYQAIKNDPSKSADEKALAEVVIAGMPFIESGTLEARLEEVRNLKVAYMQDDLLRGTRAAILSILGKEYNLSGKNPLVLTEVYKDPPFNQYFVPDNPGLSMINIEKASYELYPNTVAAITIAQTAASLDFLRKPTEQTAAHTALAEEYLQKADEAAIQDTKDNPGYMDSDRFVSYTAGRAYTVGRLAIVKGEPYKTSYRQEFDNLIAVIQSKPRPLNNELLLNARYEYARILAADKDRPAAKIQLDEVARMLNGLTNPNVYSFVQLMRNEYQYRPNGFSWKGTKNMFKISPDFEAALTKLVEYSAQ